MMKLRLIKTEVLTGVGLMVILGAGAILLSGIPLIKQLGISPLTLAIVMGMIPGNLRLFPVSGQMEKGIHMVQKRFLRLGIILYGFRISFQEILGVGTGGFLIDLFVIAATFLVGTYAGRKLFKLDLHTSILNSAGSSICGAAAVIATEGVVQGGSKRTAVAVSTVVLFGTIAMFLYPFLYTFAGLSPERFGIYIGSTIHEVAQVVVAGESLGTDVAATAVIVKMTRVMLLAPFLIFLGLFLRRPSHKEGSSRMDGSELESVLDARNGSDTETVPRTHKSRSSWLGRISIPWFAVGFIAVSALHSLVDIPASALTTIHWFDTLLLSSAMAALGMGTNYHKMKGVGIRPFLHGLFLFLFLIFFGYGINVAVGHLVR